MTYKNNAKHTILQDTGIFFLYWKVRRARDVKMGLLQHS